MLYDIKAREIGDQWSVTVEETDRKIHIEADTASSARRAYKAAREFSKGNVRRCMDNIAVSNGTGTALHASGYDPDYDI